jgi:hypothetical protein
MATHDRTRDSGADPVTTTPSAIAWGRIADGWLHGLQTPGLDTEDLELIEKGYSHACSAAGRWPALATVTRAQRNVLWRELVEYRMKPEIELALRHGNPEQAMLERDRLQVSLHVLDQLGWDRNDRRHKFTLTLDEQTLEWLQKSRTGTLQTVEDGAGIPSVDKPLLDVLGAILGNDADQGDDRFAKERPCR